MLPRFNAIHPWRAAAAGDCPIDRIAQRSRQGAVGRAAAAPEIDDLLALPVGRDGGADFAAHIRKQYDDYGRVIGEAKIKAE